MKRLPLASLSLSLILFAAGASAECNRETAPALPDGKTATLDEMKAGQQSVKAFVASGDAFLLCLAEETAAAPEDEAVEIKTARTDRHNATVDEMNAVAASFNESIRAFKEQAAKAAKPAE